MYKQNLLEPVKEKEYIRVMQDQIALHSTDYLPPYLSVWCRVECFKPSSLLKDLNSRQAWRLRAFRGTVFVMPQEITTDIRSASRIFLTPRLEEAKKILQKNRLETEPYKKEVSRLIRKNGPLMAADLRKGLSNQIPNELFTVILRSLEFTGLLIRAEQKHLTDRLIQYDLSPAVITDSQRDPNEALENIFSKYLRRFGPVCWEDIGWWFPLPKSAIRKMVDKFQKEIILFQWNRREYLMEKKDHQQLLAFQPESYQDPLVHFLPYEDHFPKAYHIRNWYLSADTLPLVYQIRKIEHGQLRPTIWLNGEIIGRWEMTWRD
ncbi:MAG: winged helix DNA-binding domain-containing protein, partial [Bacteroidales bacterium]|nr:winged helix DNA-binding domain-containing protein [Bacteroidales bacterium]